MRKVIALMGLIGLGLSLANTTWGMSVYSWKGSGGEDIVTLDFTKEKILDLRMQRLHEAYSDSENDEAPKDYGTPLPDVVKKINKEIEKYNNSSNVKLELNLQVCSIWNEDLKYLLDKVDITKFASIDFTGNGITPEGFNCLLEFAKKCGAANFPKVDLRYNVLLIPPNVEKENKTSGFSSAELKPDICSQLQELIFNAGFEGKIIIKDPPVDDYKDGDIFLEN